MKEFNCICKIYFKLQQNLKILKFVSFKIRYVKKMKTFKDKFKEGVLNYAVYLGLVFLVGCQSSIGKKELKGVG